MEIKFITEQPKTWKEKLAGNLKGKWGKVFIPLLAVALIFTGLVTFKVIPLGSQKVSTQQQRTARVTVGNINVSVTGSGAISSSNRIEVAPGVSGTITKIYFKERDKVKAGDLLFELDDSDAKLNVDKLENSMEQAQLTVSDTQKSVQNLNVRAPFDGQVTNITARVGDVLNKNANILTITDTSKLKITVPFNASVIQKILPGQKAVLNIQDMMQTVEGVVTYSAKKPYTTVSGGEIFDVEITCLNPGSLKEGMKATADIPVEGGVETSTNAGSMQYLHTQVVKSDSGGTVTKVSVRENAYVKAGETLVSLENNELYNTQQNNDLKIRDLKAQLESAKKQLSSYNVYAPISGVIVAQDSKVGDSVKPGDVVTTITDMDNLEFSISIDELDIDKIQIGQNVNITVDALTDTTRNPLTGYVKNIAVEGTSSNGVTVYPIIVQVDEAERLKIGMNVNAEILTSEKTDVLRVPLEAVQKFGNRSFVWVRGSGNTQNQQNDQTGQNRQNPGGNANGQSNRNPQGGMSRGNFTNSANMQYYANAVRKPVELGINNDEFVEVISGLNEGEVVILPPLSTGTAQNNTQMRTGGLGGLGGFGGAGGFTGGGNRNGGFNQGGGAPQGGGTSQGGGNNQRN